MRPKLASKFGLPSFGKMLAQSDARRIHNMWRIYRSYRKSLASGKSQMAGLPFSVSVEPTTSCNLRCPECPSGLRSFSRPTGMLSQDLFRKFMDESAWHIQYLNFYFQGEPFLHPRFLDLVKDASSRRIFVATSTNAHYLSKETSARVVDSGLHRLIISMDGASQAHYAAYRIGGKLEKVLQGIKHVAEARRNKRKQFPEIVVQHLLLKPSLHERFEVKRLALEAGADRVVFKTAQVYDPDTDHHLIPDEPEFSRYEKGPDGRFRIRNKLLNQCWRMWSGCVLTWDGKVVPCCFDKDASHVLGDIQSLSLDKIWYEKPYESFRNRLLVSRSEIDICRNCTEGTKVWA